MNNFLNLITSLFPKRILTKVGFINKTIQRKKSEKLQNEKELLASKFEGALLGSLIGDCIGKCLEGIWSPNLCEMLDELRLAKDKYLHYLNEQEIVSLKFYSDDTALTRSICESIINKKEFNIDDTVNNFLQMYYMDSSRGYSSATMTLFKKLSYLKSKDELHNNSFIPAMELFDGEGSYGSGAAMRCSPIALYTFSKSLEEMKIICELSTRITHNHKLAVLGAWQQCFAIRLALQTSKVYCSIDFDNFFYQILNFVNDLENNYENLDEAKYENLDKYSQSLRENIFLYLEQNKSTLFEINDKSSPKKSLSYTYLLLKLFKLIKKCRRGHKINMEYLYKLISSSTSSAIQTIPLALFSFMIASDSRCCNEVNFKLNSKIAFKQYGNVERVVFYAVSFGGEAQKIASMAGAIAGAFYSADFIPKYLIDMCEASNDVRNYAKDLFDLNFSDDTCLQEDIL
ncbi:unnamed protein product [Brachionus calyciflorus]|uniref:ADP-ribosylhydrolase ARH3 n=1 Tax=Brachionus calyciflorus TaxID=104777 RepID=A0A813MVH1_9BILA|nr:unnamed protein product [Brachionus calyciflorus]